MLWARQYFEWFTKVTSWGDGPSLQGVLAGKNMGLWLPKVSTADHNTCGHSQADGADGIV